MILNNDNLEMMLFDLLEGNLDAETEKQVRMEITENRALEREWKLMQQTVLMPETEIVFKNKKSLLKRTDTLRVAPLYFQWIGWSAAACLILTTWFGIQNKPKTDVPPIAIIQPGKLVPKAPVEMSLPKEERTKNLATEIVKVPVDVQHNRQSPVAEPPLFKKETSPITGLAISSPDLFKEPVNPDLPQVEIPIITEKALAIAEESEQQKGIKKLIADGMAKWINPYRNPKLRLAAGKSDNKPVLMFTFNTNNYHAAAVVQLKNNSNE